MDASILALHHTVSVALAVNSFSADDQPTRLTILADKMYKFTPAV